MTETNNIQPQQYQPQQPNEIIKNSNFPLYQQTENISSITNQMQNVISNNPNAFNSLLIDPTNNGSAVYQQN